MNYRLATVLARKAVTADYTEVIDLNLVDPVSQFQITYEMLTGASGPPVALAAQCVTKIELIDGSDVLYSLTGAQAQAVDYYHRKNEPGNHNIYINGQRAAMCFNMNFGRYLWDSEFAFDPRRFANPQLKITMNRSAGGKSSTAGNLTVQASIFDEKSVNPVGFLMHKQIKDYPFASASHEYTTLPTDYPIRKLFVACLLPGSGANEIFDTIKLSEDNDKRIPFNLSINEITRMIAGQNRPYREIQLASIGATDGYFFCTPTYWTKVVATSWEIENISNEITLMGGDGGRGMVYGQGLLVSMCIAVEGYLPHGVIEFPFGLQDDPNDWYDVTNVGSLKLDVLSGSGMSSSYACQVMLQQKRSY